MANIKGFLWPEIRKVPGPEIQKEFGGDARIPAMFADHCVSELKYQHQLYFFDQPEEWWLDIAVEWSDHRETSIHLH